MSNIGIRLVLACAFSLVLLGCPSSEPTEGFCAPDCVGKICGDNGCGGSCGVCQAGQTCAGGACISAQDAWEFELRIDEDAGQEAICESLGEQWIALLDQASTCQGILDCAHLVENMLPCYCAKFVSDATVETDLQQVVDAYADHSCDEGWACGACQWGELPDCVEGQCATVYPECSELQVLYSKALLESRKCSEDSDCDGTEYGALDCHCPVPVVGLDEHEIFDKLVEFWDFQDCPVPGPCDCMDGVPTCTNGVCLLVEQETQEGSKVCDTGDDCVSVSGCACGCFSQPPSPSTPECPCAGPESCVCYDGECAQPTEGSVACAADGDCFALGGCECGCYSVAPVVENSPGAPRCECETPVGCSCADSECKAIWE